MPLPTKEEVYDLARRRWQEDNSDAPTPEDYELEEDGYIEDARDYLMRSNVESRAFLEEQAAGLGLRVVSEEEQARLVDLGTRLEKVKLREAHVRESEEMIRRAHAAGPAVAVAVPVRREEEPEEKKKKLPPHYVKEKFPKPYKVLGGLPRLPALPDLPMWGEERESSRVAVRRERMRLKRFRREARESAEVEEIA